MMTGDRAVPRTVSLGSVPPQPWRNGGGVTRELLAWPSTLDWNVRVSVADVACDGPFSVLEGVDRWFAVIEGEGVALDFGGTVERITRSGPVIRFDGGRAPVCRLLGGPTRDLNLMLRKATGAITVALDHRPWAPAGEGCAFFAAVDGVMHGPADRRRVAAFDLVVFAPPPPALRFAADRDTGGPIGWWLNWSKGAP